MSFMATHWNHNHFKLLSISQLLHPSPTGKRGWFTCLISPRGGALAPFCDLGDGYFCQSRVHPWVFTCTWFLTRNSNIAAKMEEFSGKEEWIGLFVKDGDADAPNKKSYIKNAENKTTLHCDEWELPHSGDLIDKYPEAGSSLWGIWLFKSPCLWEFTIQEEKSLIPGVPEWVMESKWFTYEGMEIKERLTACRKL